MAIELNSHSGNESSWLTAWRSAAQSVGDWMIQFIGVRPTVSACRIDQHQCPGRIKYLPSSGSSDQPAGFSRHQSQRRLISSKAIMARAAQALAVRALPWPTRSDRNPRTAAPAAEEPTDTTAHRLMMRPR